MIGIIILNYNSYSLVLKLLNNLKNIVGISKIIIVDNNSTDNSVEELRKEANENVILIENKENRGYAAGNNIGIKYLINIFLNIEYMCILNPDIEIENKNIFIELIKELNKDNRLGIISPLMRMNGVINKKLISWKAPEKFDNIFNCLGITKKIKDNLNIDKEKNVIPGSFLFFSKEIIQKINYLDEETFLYYEENILAQKLKRIGKVMKVITTIEYNHIHSVERNNIKIKLFHNKIYFKSMIYYEKKYNEKYSKINIPIIRVLYYFRILEIYIGKIL